MKIALRLLAALSITLTLIAGGCGSSPSVKVDGLDAAIRDASDYLNNHVPPGSKIVILNVQSNFPDLSDYIIDELTANAVNDRIFTVVDRQQLDAIRAEQNFQWSGEVDDKSAVEIGNKTGAQTIVSGAIDRLGDGYRMRIRALEVQTAQVQGQFNRNIASSPIIAAIMGIDSSGNPIAVAPPVSGLTISGLSAHRGKYVMALCIIGEFSMEAIEREEVTSLIAAERVPSSLRNLTYTAKRIRGDTVTLDIWRVGRVGREIFTKYDGNDKNANVGVYIVNKAQVTIDDLGSSTVEVRRINVDFTNGAGSGNFAAAVSSAVPATAQ
jgi:TolB-like protein